MAALVAWIAASYRIRECQHRHRAFRNFGGGEPASELAREAFNQPQPERADARWSHAASIVAHTKLSFTDRFVYPERDVDDTAFGVLKTPKNLTKLR